MTFRLLLMSLLPRSSIVSARHWLWALGLVLLVHLMVLLSPALRWQQAEAPVLLPMLTRVIEVVPASQDPAPTRSPQKQPPKRQKEPQKSTQVRPLEAPNTPAAAPPPVLAVEQSSSPMVVASSARADPSSDNTKAMAATGAASVSDQAPHRGNAINPGGEFAGQGNDTEKVALTVPARVKLPDSRNWAFATTHQDRVSGRYYPDIPTTLKWQVQGGQYEVSLGAAAPYHLLNKLSRHSAGSVSDKGLVPDTFTASTFKGVKTITYFQNDDQKISFGKAGTVVKPLLPGSQDEISAAIQLSTMLAGEPKRYKVGDQVVINVANRSDTQVWIFNVESDELVDIPAGPTHAIKLTRSPRYPNDTGVTVWLAPEHQYMPVRLLLAYTADRYDDMKWRGF